MSRERLGTPLSPGAGLNRLTLCFADADIERDFRLQRAEASRPILRRFIIFMVVLAAVVETGVRHKLAAARAAGVPVPPQLDMSGEGLVVAAGLALVLVLFTLSRRLVPYLHGATAVCMAGLVLVDHFHSLQIPASYALYGTLLNLVVVYVASQLRFALATVLGIATTLLHLGSVCARHRQLLESDAALQLQMGLTAMVLFCTNLLLMFITHQRELLARLAYHRARLLEQRTLELEGALESLKRAELQLVETEKQATVGRLVAGILHEMNTPLGALSSATQTLQRGLERLRRLSGDEASPVAATDGAPRSPRRAEESRVLLEAAERLTGVQVASGRRIREVVEDLRQFVALDHSALQTFDVRGGLETAVALTRPNLPSGVTLELDVPPCPVWVKGFPAKLNQVFLNLLRNAVSSFDAAAPGSAERAAIVVSARVSGGRVGIEVRDTGRGIAPEQLERIFDLDFSRHGPRVKLHLGLPASRGVVEAIGGKLTLESRLGQGSTAMIELPLEETPKSAAALTPAPSPIAERAPPAARVHPVAPTVPQVTSSVPPAPPRAIPSL